VIDLHLHTTASDGWLTPTALVDRAADAGIRILAVTDHDTTAGIGEATAEAVRRGLEIVPGIEITAVNYGSDVHMLGYFFDVTDHGLIRFLTAQRETRIVRVIEIAKRLTSLGMPVDVQPLLDEAARHNSKSIGRPQLARAMIEAGYVADTREAFDKWLGRGGPAFVERPGAPPEEVIAIVHRAGGVVSLAHPGRTKIDADIPRLREHGLDAIEAYHSDHDDRTSRFYLQTAQRLELSITGGSDFHGDPRHGLEPGTASLPEADWSRLLTRINDGRR
jgi:3',5'-nucleoside bisphosphate phosphatase